MAISATATSRHYPILQDFGDRRISFRLMTDSDSAMLLKFANQLPEADLIFLRMDITQPEVVAEWVNNIERAKTITLIAEEDGTMIAYGSIHYNQLQWTRHMGELRIMVSPKFRGLSIGRFLVNELFQLAKELGLERVVVQIPSNQPRVRKMFEDLDFAAAALLTDWLKDRNNRTHDLIIMSRNMDL